MMTALYGDTNQEVGKRYGLKIGVIVAFSLAVAGALFTRAPLPQDPEYHDFADQRTLLGIPHCLNVLSNIPFLIVGPLGILCVVRDSSFRERRERCPYLLLFSAIFFTAFGSAYYHLEPTNARLMWDRLPMAVAFMSLFAAMISERLSPTLGTLLFPFLVAAGVASVLYWHVTEMRGAGDLRPYYFVQFFPMLAIPLLWLLFPPRYTGTGYLVAALGFYAAAKVLEHPLDKPLYECGQLLSGHTLKHLAAAAGALCILHMLRRRRPASAHVAKI